MFVRKFTRTVFKLQEKQKKYQVTRDTLQWSGVIFSLSALAFQISVLYPWHPEVEHHLSDLISKIEENQKDIVINTEKIKETKQKIKEHHH
jgi:hypothetical protein